MVSEQVKQDVLNTIDSMHDEIVQALCDVIRIPSVNPNIAKITGEYELFKGKEKAVSEFLGGIMKDMGLEVDLFELAELRTNVVGRFKSGGKGKSLLFNGHIDVVPPGDPDTWKVSKPFEGKIQDGRVYGRGACDMKSGIIASVMALKAILKAGYKPAGDVLIEGAVGEEQMEHHLGTTAIVEKGYTADADIVTEPSEPYNRLGIVPACCNTAWLVIEVKGKSTHGSMRGEMIRAGGAGEEVGVSSIDKAMLIYNGLRQLEEQWAHTKKHPLYKPGHFTIHCGVVQGGPEGAFAISAASRLEYSIWGAPQETEESLKSEITDYIRKICELDPWLKENPPKLSWPAFWNAYDLPVDAPICQTVADSLREAIGEEPKFHGFYGNTDAPWLNLKGIPSISLGPGNMYVAHAPDEFVEIKDVIDAAKIYALSILNWCGME